MKDKKIMGIDLGTVRTGVAISDISRFLASPVGTIEEKDMDVLADKITKIASENEAGKIVLGHPKNMDGTCGESALRSEDFAQKLKDKTDLPIILWDERMTTDSAIGYLNATNTRGKKRKAVIDTVAATIILQSYLDSI